MRFGKKLVVLLLAMVLALTAFAGTVSAADIIYNDGLNFFSIPNTVITQYAWSYIYPCQQKTDTNSLYLYYEGNQEEVAVRAMGCTNTKGDGMTNASYNYGQYVAFYICEQEMPYRIVSRVREDGFNYCSLGFFPMEFSGLLSGAWHPSLKTTNYYFPEIGAYE